ncbi:MAG: hypothetical protein O2800_01790 [Planctomycetota bacterium]|nr:hypothetical protein [Planctomycetota bacterium]
MVSRVPIFAIRIAFLIATLSGLEGCHTPPSPDALTLEALCESMVPPTDASEVELRGQAELCWRDGETNRRDKVDLRLWIRANQDSALDLSALGTRMAWIGANATQWWMFELESKPPRLSTGDVAQDVSTGTLPPLADVRLLRVLLGLTPPPMDGSLSKCVDADQQPMWCSADGTIQWKADGSGVIVKSSNDVWTSSWSGRVEASGIGARYPSRIDFSSANSSNRMTVWVRSILIGSTSAKDVYFDLERLKVLLRTEINQESVR